MDVRRFQATVEYDGTDFSGYQRQGQGERTVQQILEQAVQAVTAQAVTVLGAGRTDAGVHALGQVIAFDVEWRHDEEALGRALNANLPADVAVRQVVQVSETFHPRFSARRRRYKYKINNHIVRSPLLRRTMWHYRRPLDHVLMNRASQYLIGRQDFATFGQPPSGVSTVRQVYRAEWHRDHDLLEFIIEADAYLYRMVRSLVGSLCLVGVGDWSVDAFADALAAADRSQAGPTAPPHGLCLVAVSYDQAPTG